jgi:hypothetical protein
MEGVPMGDLTNFDPIAIGNQIAALETEAQDGFTTAQGVFLSRSEAIAAILWDVAQHHPEHLDAVCKHAKIGRSRRDDLLQIGGGRKTIEKQRQENAARQAKFKAKKKVKQVAAAEVSKAVPVTTPQVTGTFAAQPKAGKDKSADKPTTTKSPTDSKSAKALVEFKVACDHWLSQLTKCDKLRAVNYVQVRTGAIPETELAA